MITNLENETRPGATGIPRLWMPPTDVCKLGEQSDSLGSPHESQGKYRRKQQRSITGMSLSQRKMDSVSRSRDRTTWRCTEGSTKNLLSTPRRSKRSLNSRFEDASVQEDRCDRTPRMILRVSMTARSQAKSERPGKSPANALSSRTLIPCRSAFSITRLC